MRQRIVWGKINQTGASSQNVIQKVSKAKQRARFCAAPPGVGGVMVAGCGASRTVCTFLSRQKEPRQYRGPEHVSMDSDIVHNCARHRVTAKKSRKNSAAEPGSGQLAGYPRVHTRWVRGRAHTHTDTHTHTHKQNSARPGWHRRHT